MAKIKWSKDSIDDLKEICRFIAEDSPYYATLFKDRVFEMVEHVELFPEIGRKVPEADYPTVRELIYKNALPPTADNRVLEGKTQRLCPSQTLETLSGILNILFILKRFRNLTP